MDCESFHLGQYPPSEPWQENLEPGFLSAARKANRQAQDYDPNALEPLRGGPRQSGMDVTNLILSLVLSNCSVFSESVLSGTRVPISTNAVREFKVARTFPSLWVCLTLTNRCAFNFQNGVVYYYRHPSALWGGSLNKLAAEEQATMSQEDALLLARSFLPRLGYAPEDLYADLAPRVEQVPHTGHYLFTWLDPTEDSDLAEDLRIEIDTVSHRLLYFWSLGALAAGRPEPDIPGLKELRETERKRQLARTPGYKRDYLGREDPRMGEALPKLAQMVEALRLPFGTNALRDEIASAFIHGQWLTPQLVLLLTNGYRLSYDVAGGKAVGFSGPKPFFGLSHPRLRDYTGQWTMSEPAARSLVTNAVARIGFNLDPLFAKNPGIDRPRIRGNITVPRLRFTWEDVTNEGVLSQAVYAEVDAGSGTLVSLDVIKY